MAIPSCGRSTYIGVRKMTALNRTKKSSRSSSQNPHVGYWDREHATRFEEPRTQRTSLSLPPFICSKNFGSPFLHMQAARILKYAQNSQLCCNIKLFIDNSILGQGNTSMFAATCPGGYQAVLVLIRSTANQI